MASKAPPIPPEQRAFPGQKPHVQDGGLHARAPSNPKEQARHGSVHQNTHHGHQQDR